MEGPEVVARPRTITAAYLLWMIVAATLILFGGFLLVTGWLAFVDATNLTASALLVVLGFAVWWFGTLLAGGRDVRLVLLVMGGASCLALLPAVFAVAAIVLQFVPPSQRWFQLAPLDQTRGEVL
ncbi:hypothetical protein OG394_07210 [Kribbella sp. NBC_01245]|uniref:hypothetical protein n=1 Tax=Kribbella sp. NBC_01245 TaxID=2903578 RepID=UPI002E2AB82B|nr:hypothetical protein [Kribbella sp. NBC_01245]